MFLYKAKVFWRLCAKMLDAGLDDGGPTMFEEEWQIFRVDGQTLSLLQIDRVGIRVTDPDIGEILVDTNGNQSAARKSLVWCGCTNVQINLCGQVEIGKLRSLEKCSVRPQVILLRWTKQRLER